MVKYATSLNNIHYNTPVTQTAISYTALITDYVIEVTSTAAPRTITLASPSTTGATVNVGKILLIKDTSGAAGTNNITISPTTGLIDGAASLVIAVNYGFAQVYCDGTAWYSIASNLTISTAFVWNAVAGTSQALAATNGYYTQNSATTTLSLPVGSCPAGSVIEIHGSGTGLFVISQGSGQQIRLEGGLSTAGATGSLQSSNQGDSVKLLCTTTASGSAGFFEVISATGNLLLI